MFMFNQTLKDIEDFDRDVGEYGLSYDDFKPFCWKGWEEEQNYFGMDGSKKRLKKILHL